MKKYVKSNEQFIVELYVKDLQASIGFYEKLGFKLIRCEKHFASLGWEESFLFLEEVLDFPVVSDVPACNIRIMVPDVDRCWTLCLALGLKIIRPIDDRYYGLRDFTALSPDGIGLRFATNL